MAREEGSNTATCGRRPTFAKYGAPAISAQKVFVTTGNPGRQVALRHAIRIIFGEKHWQFYPPATVTGAYY